MSEKPLDTPFNKLRAEMVLELIRNKLRRDCTDDRDPSGGLMAFWDITALCIIMLEARGFEVDYDKFRAANEALGSNDHFLAAARQEAVETLAEDIVGQGVSLAYNSDNISVRAA